MVLEMSVVSETPFVISVSKSKMCYFLFIFLIHLFWVYVSNAIIIYDFILEKWNKIKQVQTPKDILNARRLIFPGVGAFAPAMDVLNNTGFVFLSVFSLFQLLLFVLIFNNPFLFCINICRMGEALCTYIQNDRPFLGICLGLQLLFESSEENGPGQSRNFFC